MTIAQNLWILLCTIGPAIYVGFSVAWWAGILAYIAAIIINALIGFASPSIVPVRFLALSAYVKYAIVGLLILAVGNCYGS